MIRDFFWERQNLSIGMFFKDTPGINLLLFFILPILGIFFILAIKIFERNLDNFVKSFSFEVVLQKLLINNQDNSFRRKAIDILFDLLFQKKSFSIEHFSCLNNILFHFGLGNDLPMNNIEQTGSESTIHDHFLLFDLVERKITNKFTFLPEIKVTIKRWPFWCQIFWHFFLLYRFELIYLLAYVLSLHEFLGIESWNERNYLICNAVIAQKGEIIYPDRYDDPIRLANDRLQVLLVIS